MTTNLKTSRSAVALACAGALVLLAGCSTLESLNPFSKGPKNPPAKLVDFAQTMKVRTAWEVSVGAADEFAFSPVLAGESLYAASANGTIVRINPASGKEVWRIDADARLSAGVGSDGAVVAVAADKGRILAFDADGKALWTAQASSEVLSAPTVGGGVVIVRSVDNRLVAFDAKSGARRWNVQRTAPPLTLRNSPGIAIAGNLAIASMPGGKLLALTLNNGAPAWESTVSDPKGATELERIADTSGTPVVIGREVCAATYQGKVGCFDLSNGQQRWAKEMSTDVGLAVDQRFVFGADESGVVNAFARESGASVWRNDKLKYRRLSAPASIGRAVAVGDFEGQVHFLSREDGAFVARVPTDGSPIAGTPLVSGSQLVVQTRAGKIVALATE